MVKGFPITINVKFFLCGGNFCNFAFILIAKFKIAK